MIDITYPQVIRIIMQKSIYNIFIILCTVFITHSIFLLQLDTFYSLAVTIKTAQVVFMLYQMHYRKYVCITNYHMLA